MNGITKCLFLNNFGRHLETGGHFEKNNFRIEFLGTNYRGIHVSHDLLDKILRELGYFKVFHA
jgi:hypothetical protein